MSEPVIDLGESSCDFLDNNNSNHVKIIGHDGLIGSVPKASDIIELKVVDGKFKVICEKVIKFIEDNLSDACIPFVIISAGSFFLAEDEFLNAPKNFHERIKSEILQEFDEVSDKIYQVVKNRGGKIEIASILPQLKFFQLSTNDQQFFSGCYEDFNSRIWRFNKTNGLMTPNLKEFIEYKVQKSKKNEKGTNHRKDNKLQGCFQKKFSKCHFTDDFHFNKEMQSKFLRKLLSYMDKLAK